MLDRHWYRKDKGSEVHDAIVAHGQTLEAAQRSRTYLDIIHERIYRGSALLSTGGMSAALDALQLVGMSTPRLNVTKSVVDTACSKLGKDRPMPQAVVDDAEWSVKRKARKLSRFVRGQMRASKFDDVSREVLRKGEIRGSGVMKVTPAFGKIVVEDVAREEILIDPRDGMHGQPRQLLQRKLVDRDVLAAMFPEHESAIRDASPATLAHQEYYDELGTTMHSEEDRIEVFEAWHRRSGPDGKDGRHAIAIATATLEFEEWERDYFPFAVFHWSPPLRGFWGFGLVHELASIQESINNIVRDIQRNIEFAGRLIAMTRRGSGIAPGQLTGRKPFQLEYEGQPPQFIVPNAVSPAQLQMLAKLEQSAYDLTGVSQMSAQSRNPVGAGASGRALDNFYDIQLERFADVQANYAGMRLQGSRLILDAAYDLAEEVEDSSYTLSWTEKRSGGSMSMTTMDWKDLALERETFNLELEPVNFLPDTRAGKLAEVEQLAKAGVIDGDMASVLFDEPDLERANRIRNAAYNNLERIMEELADESEEVNLFPLTPTPYHDLGQAKEMAVAYYNRAQAEGAPEYVLERYRWFLSMVEAESKPVTPPAQPGAAPPPGAEGMSPEMAPPGMPPMPGQPPLPPEAMAQAMPQGAM